MSNPVSAHYEPDIPIVVAQPISNTPQEANVVEVSVDSTRTNTGRPLHSHLYTEPQAIRVDPFAPTHHHQHNKPRPPADIENDPVTVEMPQPNPAQSQSQQDERWRISERNRLIRQMAWVFFLVVATAIVVIVMSTSFNGGRSTTSSFIDISGSPTLAPIYSNNPPTPYPSNIPESFTFQGGIDGYPDVNLIDTVGLMGTTTGGIYTKDDCQQHCGFGTRTYLFYPRVTTGVTCLCYSSIFTCTSSGGNFGTYGGQVYSKDDINGCQNV